MYDSGDFWGAILTAHVRNDLEAIPQTGDPSLYIKQSLGSYADDFYLEVTNNLKDILKKQVCDSNKRHKSGNTWIS